MNLPIVCGTCGARYEPSSDVDLPAWMAAHVTTQQWIEEALADAPGRP